MALGVLVFLASALTQLSIGFHDEGRQAREQTAAAHFAMQGLEAVRSIAEQDFDNLLSGTRGIDDAAGIYTFSESLNTSGKFTRAITVAPVQRDSNGQIVSGGGTEDPDTKAITSAVHWKVKGNRSNTVSFLTYLTNWTLRRWIIDLVADFRGGYRNSTTITRTEDGEIQLRAVNNLKTPQEFFTHDVPGSSDPTEMQIDRDTDLLYLTLANNPSGNSEFLAYDISAASNGNLTLSASLDTGDAGRGFALGGDAYAYVLTNDDAQEILVVRLSDLQIAARWNIPSNANPNDIVLDSATKRAYVVTDDDGGDALYVLDISNPLSPTAPIVQQATIGRNVYALAMHGSYAYLVTANNNAELVIVNTATMNQVQCDLPGNRDTKRIHIAGTRLFVGRDGGEDPEFTEYTINPSAPNDCAYITSHIAGSTQLGSDDVLAMYVDAAQGLAFVMTSDSGGDLVVIDLSTYVSSRTDLAGSLCDSVTFLGAYIYAGCRDDTKTVQVLRGSGRHCEELLYTDDLRNNWTLSNNGGNTTNALSTFLVRTGTASLSLNPAAGGSTQLSKNYTNYAGGSLDFYVNTVSPWAFGIYGEDAGTPHSTTAVANATYGTVYQTNTEEGAFTDFPVANYAAMKTRAQSTNSFINAGNSDYTLTSDQLAAFAGKLVFVEFSNATRNLTVDFTGNPVGGFNVSIVTQGGGQLQLDNYLGAVLTPVSSAFPALAAPGQIRLIDNATVTVNGLIYTQHQVDSSILDGAERLRVNGAIVAATVNSNLERTVVTYTTDFHTNPPVFFSPNYFGQNLQIQADVGTAVNMNSYLSGALDKAPATWQLVSIPLSALGIQEAAIAYVRFTDISGTNQPTIFFDDMRFVRWGDTQSLSQWGTFTTPPFDSASDTTTWKKLQWKSSGVGPISFRIRTANTEQNLKKAQWVGPDGTRKTVYTQSAGQRLVTDPGATGKRFLQWKAYLAGLGSWTPILEDITVTFQ